MDFSTEFFALMIGAVGGLATGAVITYLLQQHFHRKAQKLRDRERTTSRRFFINDLRHIDESTIAAEEELLGASAATLRLHHPQNGSDHIRRSLPHITAPIGASRRTGRKLELIETPLLARDNNEDGNEDGFSTFASQGKRASGSLPKVRLLYG